MASALKSPFSPAANFAANGCTGHSKMVLNPVGNKKSPNNYMVNFNNKNKYFDDKFKKAPSADILKKNCCLK